MMRRQFNGVMTAVLFASFRFLPAQEKNSRLLDAEAARRFLPERVSVEMDTVSLDLKNSSVLQFPNKSRIAVAVLLTSGMPDASKKKYQYVFVAEARVKFENRNLASGMVGLALEPESKPSATTRTLVVRDFSGTVTERMTLKLSPSSQRPVVALTPKGPRDFELRIGKYVILGSQR